MTNERSEHPDDPLDPFEEDVPLASGPDDVGFLRTPTVGARLSSSLVDMVVMFLMVGIPSLLLPLLILHPVKGQKITAEQNRTITLIYLVVVIVVLAGYLALERLKGASMGRRLLGLRLITKEGARPSWGRLLLKYAAVLAVAVYPLFFLLVLLALLYASVQPERRNGLDLLAGTRVVLR